MGLKSGTPFKSRLKEFFFLKSFDHSEYYLNNIRNGQMNLKKITFPVVIVAPEFAWKEKKKKPKTNPNTKLLPIFNG